MLSEEHIIPYQVSPLPSGPWLVFAPHADDETFGMGGALLLARAAGLHTQVVVMTDGALGGPAEASAQLAATRAREAETAARFLGIERLTLLKQPDRSLMPSPALSARLSELIRHSGAQSVFFPGPLEPHPDHRATALLVWQALATIPQPQRPLPLAYEISVQNPANCLLDISAVMPAKCQAMALYRSQLSQNNYIDIVAALNKTRTYTLPPAVTHAEAFFRHPVTAPDSPLQSTLHQQMSDLLV
ncbi:MAG: PIG-L deacetylase family protein [Pseudomonadales bacterium]|nr:PIG-L deacetylase family protein [Pseudomonadales bacterium]